MAAQVKTERPMPTEIQEGLRKIRLRRLISHGPFCTFFLTGLLSAGLSLVAPLAAHALTHHPLFNLVLAPIGFASVTMFFVSVVGLKCPRCNNFFHAGPRYRNDFTRKCLHCGLRLNGSNAGKPF